MPAVSVIIPVYNGEQYLQECLDSVARQSLNDLEILCVDDGSTDGSAAILKDYAGKDARFRFLPQKNQGVSAARNRAIRLAQGDFVAFLDCDDRYPADNTLEQLFSAAMENNADIAGGSLNELNPDGHIVSVFSGKRAPLTLNRSGWINFADCPYEYAFQRYLFRKSLLTDHGLEFPPYRVFEDPVFLVRSMIAAKRFFAIPNAVYLYRTRRTPPTFTPEKVRDLAAGGIDILRAAKDADLPGLFRKYSEDFFGDFSEGDESATGNLCISKMLAGDTVLAKMLFDASDLLDGKLIAPLAKILGGNMPAGSGFFDSPEWTELCRKHQRADRVRGLFRCLSENGPFYMLKRIFNRN